MNLEKFPAFREKGVWKIGRKGVGFVNKELNKSQSSDPRANLLKETTNTMAIPNIKKDIAKSRNQIKKGKYIPLADLK